MNILMIGGSGFIGRHLAQTLAERGHSVTVPTRRRERARHLLVLPTVSVVEDDVHDPRRLQKLMANQQAVINLVGILRGGNGTPYGAGFSRAHVELPRKIALAMQTTGLRRLLHVSALRAAATAPSGYLRSKAAGEAAIAAVRGLDVTVFRPSVIFGAGDAFLTLFARLQRCLPIVPLACAEAQFQPVWVGDVAASMADSLQRDETFGKSYELCGPEVYTLRQLVAQAGVLSGHRRPIVGLPHAVAYLQAWAMEFVPGAPLSRDNLRSMQLANISSGGPALPFGRQPMALETVAPGYLKRGG